MNSLTKADLEIAFKNFTDQAIKKHGSSAGHAYVAGYLESMVVRFLMQLSAEERAREMQSLERSSVWDETT